MLHGLAEKITRDLFEVFDSKDDKCQRFEAKGGKWPDDETSLGGWCEMAMAEKIEKSLRKHLDT